MDLASDGAYDSRGNSALVGKVVLADLRTKLVLHTEVLHRSETGNILFNNEQGPRQDRDVQII